jgi:hypothetical protein
MVLPARTASFAAGAKIANHIARDKAAFLSIADKRGILGVSRNAAGEEVQRGFQRWASDRRTSGKS